MAGPLRIYNDTQTRKLAKSFADPAEVSFPELKQGEVPIIQLFFQDSTDGTANIPFTRVNFAGSTLKLGIVAGDPTGGPDTLIAYQDSWTGITNGFQGALNLNTVGISNAIGNASSRACTVEIEVTEAGGNPVKYYQGPVTIKAAVIDGLSTVPTPIASYLTKNEARATYVPIVGVSSGSITLVSQSGTKAIILTCTNDSPPQLGIATIDPYTP